MSTLEQTISDNLCRVREQIAESAVASGRTPDDISLVGVTKYVSAEATAALVAAGCAELGESRPQQLWSKAAELADLPIHWHMIGHLQRNKVERTIKVCDFLHSIDSERLLRAVSKSASELDRTVQVLLEVNCSGEAEKHGLQAAQVEPLLELAAELKNIKICGLMTMAAREGGEAVARKNFATLRQLRDELQQTTPQGKALKHLSMGMSGDMQAAILEGSTLVRVGSALWQGIE